MYVWNNGISSATYENQVQCGIQHRKEK